MNDVLRNDLYMRLNKILRFTEENTFELRSIFNRYEQYISTGINGMPISNGASLECGEIDSYVLVFMDSKINYNKRKDAYKVIYSFLMDKIKPIN